jgi:hypothetical protein
MAHAMFNKTLIRNPMIARQVFESAPSLRDSKSISKLAKAWARSDFEAAKRFVTSQDNPALRNSGVASIMEEWGRRDPAAAITYLEESPAISAGGYGSSYYGLIRGWAGKDPEAAFQYAKSFDPGPAIMGATFSALQAWIKDDPQAAVGAMESMSDKVYPSAQIAKEWAKVDLDAAKEWLKTYNHPSRYSGMSSLIQDLAKTDFKKAAQLHQEFTEWPESGDPDANEIMERAGADLARSWMRHNRDEAFVWIDTLPAGGAKDGIISSAVNEFGSHLPEKASELADSLPPGELRTSTISRLVQDLRQQGNPVQAFEASQLLLDEKIRLAKTEDLLRRIKANDQGVALDLLDRANIPTADRERIRGTFQ